MTRHKAHWSIIAFDFSMFITTAAVKRRTVRVARSRIEAVADVPAGQETGKFGCRRD